jgi:hypothetical protein
MAYTQQFASAKMGEEIEELEKKHTQKQTHTPGHTEKLQQKS